MQLIFHGGAQEVGRSCVEVRTGNDRYLLDCGLKFHEGGYDYPAKVFQSEAIDAVFISHAHLDHSGGLPFFEHYKLNCPIIMTEETKSMVKTLLEDSQRIADFKHMVKAFTDEDLEEIFDEIRLENFDTEKRFKTIKYKFLNAGHIPGSATIKMETEKISLLYTGDYQTVETNLMQGADPHTWGEVDVLITESTYGDKDHTPRKETEENFLDKVEEVLARGGRVLVPVFAVGRAQEILLLLSRREWDVPIYMDGMARKITKSIYQGNSPYVKGRKKMHEMMDNIYGIKNRTKREAIAEKPGIFVTTSGMLQGGPAMTYLEHLHSDPKSAVLLTGFQVQNTKGWYLKNKKTVKFQGQITEVACEVQSYEFSAHLPMSEIQRVVKSVKPKVLILMHGSPEGIQILKQWAEKDSGCKVYAPHVGDQIDISDDGNVSHMHLYTADDGYKFPDEHQHKEKPVVAYDDFSWSNR